MIVFKYCIFINMINYIKKIVNNFKNNLVCGCLINCVFYLVEVKFGLKIEFKKKIKKGLKNFNPYFLTFT